jgi:hypothetical protein
MLAAVDTRSAGLVCTRRGRCGLFRCGRHGEDRVRALEFFGNR